MKIALITSGIWPYVIGGIEKHSFYLAKYWAHREIEIDLYHSYRGKEPKNEELDCFTAEEKKYITSIVIPFPNKDTFIGHYIRNSRKYSQLVYQSFQRREKPDFIYIQGFSGWELMQAKQLGTKLPPTLLNFHGLEMYQLTADWKGTLASWMFRPYIKQNLLMSNYVQSLGGKLTGILQNVGVPRDRIIEIGIGVSSDWLNTKVLTVNPIRKMIFVGRYERRKGIEELMEVLGNHTFSTSFEFHFIGAIPPEKQLKQAHIVYHGQVSEQSFIQSVLQGADILVCPSYAEGMPTVILEAMASGCAVIATDVGAVSETVDSSNGWLLPKPDKQLLIAAMEEALICDTSTLIAYKQRSIEKIKERFLWENVIDRLILHIKTNTKYG